MKSESQNRILIIPTSWKVKASKGVARLNLIQPCYFLYPLDWDFQPENLSKALEVADVNFTGQAGLLILPRSFATAEKIPFWPKPIQSNQEKEWTCGLFFADDWEEVESYLLEFHQNEDQEIPIQVSCQYQHPYTEMLEFWAAKGAISYHPGDYFKEDFLIHLKSMEGIWGYWGHAEGDRLRGYGHLTREELLFHRPAKALDLTLWFSCSTLDFQVVENIGLSWFLSGCTKTLLASPFKVKTEDNQRLGLEFLDAFSAVKKLHLSDILLSLVRTNNGKLKDILDQYRLLGIPWIRVK